MVVRGAGCESQEHLLAVLPHLRGSYIRERLLHKSALRFSPVGTSVVYHGARELLSDASAPRSRNTKIPPHHLKDFLKSPQLTHSSYKLVCSRDPCELSGNPCSLG